MLLNHTSALCLTAACFLALSSASAQQPASPGDTLDLQGKGPGARVLFQKQADDAATPAAKAAAHRSIAMSWAFEGNCAKTLEYEQMVMDYWVTQQQSQPGNAFYQQGEMANEGARVCIDSGDLAAADKWYRKGADLGLREPGISADRKALWEFRLEHALARLAARRGDRAEAARHVAAATLTLDAMTTSRTAQQAFLPYLTGYVALYLGDYQAALADLQKARSDAFIQCLIGQTWEKLGEKDKAMELYRLAAAARGHNPPAAYGVPFARKKLGL